MTRRLEAATAVYHFQLDIPTTSFGGGALRAPDLELTLYCRHKSASTKSLVSKVARGLSLVYMHDADPLSFHRTLPRAQEILNNNELHQSVKSRTCQLFTAVRRVQCVSIRSRYKQVNSKCFLEVSCENTHPFVRVVLRDLTLHTFTSRPISMRVTRLGRWVLPLALHPGERHTVCFVLSNFEEIAPKTYFEGDADARSAASDGIGSRYTSVATVTWTSDVTLLEVRGKHRVEWDFASGVFDKISLRLERIEKDAHRDDGRRDDGSLQNTHVHAQELRPGCTFQLLLVISNRSGTPTDLRVVLPVPEDLSTEPLLPLDASIHVGSVGDDAVQVPLSFLALHPAHVDIAKLVHVVDVKTKARIAVKEPHHVSIL